MIKGLNYVVVTTDDVPRARGFYPEVLGLSTEDDIWDEFSQFTTREGSLWALMRRPEGAMKNGTELYLEVNDADETFRALKDRGVEIVAAPRAEPYGRMFAFKDADGRVLNAYTRP